MHLAPLRVLLVSLVLSACAGAPRPGDPGYPFNTAGSYTGRFHFGDDPFDATMQLRTAPGGAVRGAFRITTPVVIEGSVEGRIVEDLLRVTIVYRSPNDCDGRIEGILSVEEGGGVIDGPIRVSDCGPPVAGRMDFQRRPSR